MQPDGSKDSKLVTPPLEGMDIRWYRVGPQGKEEEMVERSGQKEWKVGADDTGIVRAKVAFRTPEVRKYDDKFQTSRDLRLS